MSATTGFDKQRNTWHRAGIHLHCGAPTVRHGRSYGDGSYQRCVDAGKVAPYHHHDFDGPLPCMCDDFGEDDF